MVRPKKTTRINCNFTEDQMKKAIALVQSGISIRKVAKMEDITYRTLCRYVTKHKSNPSCSMLPYSKTKQIFSDAVETDFSKYLEALADNHFTGLCIMDCRRLAYDLAKMRAITPPDNWAETRRASNEWYKGYRARQAPHFPLLNAIRFAPTTSRGFTKANADGFYAKLARTLQKHPRFLDGSRLYNLDEIALSTTSTCWAKTLAAKRRSQIAENGAVVTICAIVGAQGAALPPALVYPVLPYDAALLSNGPAGAVGFGSRTGCLNTKLYARVIEHFIQVSDSSTQNPAVLVVDNHESHLALGAVDLCRANGVEMVAIPAKCEHKLQPLDGGLLENLHGFYEGEMAAGGRVGWGEVGGLVARAYGRAMRPERVAEAFEKTGVFPFDRSVFGEGDYVLDEVVAAGDGDGLEPALDVVCKAEVGDEGQSSLKKFRKGHVKLEKDDK